MSSRIKNMTEGKPVFLIISFALPLMVGNVFQQLYTVVDTMVVGKALGVGALAALGAADWLNWMMLGTIQGLTQGFGILMAQEFGAGRHERLRKVVGNATVLSALGALLLLIAGQLVARPVLVLLQTPEEIIGNALLYLRIMFLGIPIVMAYNFLATILRSLGDGKTPLHAMIVAALTNIALDLLFVLVFGWGIAGAAVATLIGQLVSSLFCLWHIRKIEMLALKKPDFCMEGYLGKKLLYLGSPMALQGVIISVGGMIVQFVVNGFGVLFIAGFTATNKLYGVLEVAATSYGYAMVTYVGQNLGAGKIDRIRKGVRGAGRGDADLRSHRGGHAFVRKNRFGLVHFRNPAGSGADHAGRLLLSGRDERLPAHPVSAARDPFGHSGDGKHPAAHGFGHRGISDASPDRGAAAAGGRGNGHLFRGSDGLGRGGRDSGGQLLEDHAGDRRAVSKTITE